MKTRLAILLLLLAVSTPMVLAKSKSASTAKRHPVIVTEMPNCGQCHTDQWKRFNHQADDFYAKHRYYAQAQRLACSSCHKDSYCSDCHAHKEESKPSDKFANSPNRNLPHRGDYLGRHMIDGQVNPAACAKCHGRQNNERCQTCHR
jgi:hypothetical protein